VGILLVRHASAGQREEWDGDDALRPLDADGRRQADGLAELLSAYPVTRIVTSPALRCVQTVEPLAERLGVALEERRELTENSAVEDTMRLLTELDATAVVCSHGDVIQNLIAFELDHEGATWSFKQWEKGSAWVLERQGDDFVPTVYIPPA
jgi:8-oxo-dGTP diphosphatase